MPATPNALARELGVSASAVRQRLRDEADRGRETGPWQFDELNGRVRARFTATASARAARPTVCAMDG